MFSLQVLVLFDCWRILVSVYGKYSYGDSGLGYSYVDPINQGMKRIPVGKEYDELVRGQVSIDMQVNASNDKRMRIDKRDGRNKKYVAKLAAFSVTFGILFLVYIVSFINGTDLGLSMNNATDSLIDSFIGTVLGDGSKANALSSVMTLGPISYIVISGVIAFIVSLFASRWCSNKIRYRLADGTRNLVSEKQAENDAQSNETIADRLSSKRDELLRAVRGDDDLGDIPDAALGDSDELGSLEWDA